MLCSLMKARNPFKAAKPEKWRWDFETLIFLVFSFVATNLFVLFCVIPYSFFVLFFYQTAFATILSTDGAHVLISLWRRRMSYNQRAPHNPDIWLFHCSALVWVLLSLLWFPPFFPFCKSVWLITWIISDCDKLQWASSQEAKTRSLT